MIINMGALNLKSLSLEKDSCVIAQIVLVDRKLGFCSSRWQRGGPRGGTF